jgi:predicted permease
VDVLRQDLRYALRTLLRAPGFTIVTALTIALGIAGTTSVLGLVNTVLFRPLPVPQPERLVSLSELRERGPGGPAFSYPEYVALRDGTDVFTGLAAQGLATFGLGGEGAVEPASGGMVSGNYFAVLGVRPALGRLLLPEDDQVGGATAVAVLSHELWRGRFGADPAVVGRTVRLNAQPVEVVGVAPAGFTGTVIGMAPDLWVPIAARAVLAPGMMDRPSGRFSWLQLTGRLAPGVTRAQAEERLGALAREIAAAQTSPRPVTGIALDRAGTAPAMMRGVAIGVLSLLLAAAGLVLLIASTNVAGMLLARSPARRREIAIRRAIGARTPRVLRQLLTESVLLGLLGGGIGIVLSVWVSSLLTAWRPALPMSGGRIALDLGPDLPVLGAALALSLLTGLLFGLAPALQTTRLALLPALQEAGRGSAPRSRLRDGLVVLQIALSLLLLLGAGLFLRALQRAADVDPGFRAEGVTVASINLDPYGFDASTGREFHRQLVERLRTEPGVEAVGLSEILPLTGVELTWSVVPPGQTEKESFPINLVGPDHFAALGIPLLRGRDFGEQDREGTPPVAMVNEAFARRYFPGQDAVGQALQVGSDATQVIGVVGDVRYASLREEPRPMLFFPLAQHYSAAVTIQVRAAGGEATTAAAMQRAVGALNPAVVLTGAQPLSAAIGIAILPQRLAAAAAGLFGLVGLLLAAIGLYGVIAYAVGQRTREIGIRTALGASATDIVRLVLRHALALVGGGILLGLLAGVGATRLLAGFLFGVSPTDPLTMTGVVTLLLGVALLASFLPVRRATRVDPVIALRSE